MMSRSPDIIQWNANGLKGAKLDQFKQQLSTLSPSLVLLSGTHWRNEFVPTFHAYNSVYSNRPDGYGGVAILIKKNLKFKLRPLPNPLVNLEVISITVLNWLGVELDVFSVYSPNGSAASDPFNSLFQSVANNYSIIGGDVNAHHSSWTSFHNNNNNGVAIASSLLNSPNWILITPKDTATRHCGASGKISTIDLTFATTDFPPICNYRIGPFWDSDHLPVFISLADDPTPLQPPPTWCFRDKKWTRWNDVISSHLNTISFDNISSPESAYDALYSTIISASNSMFSPTANRRQPKSCPPWWNEECSKAVGRSRQAYSRWKKCPSPSNKQELNKQNAIKKRTIIREKNAAWATFVDNLDPRKGTKKVWKFANSMMKVHKNSYNDWINLPSLPYETVFDKKKRCCSIFLDQFTDSCEPLINSVDPITASLDSQVQNRIDDQSGSPLNEPFIIDELTAAIKSSKSNAMGSDLIHRQMLQHLSRPNLESLLRLFNLLLKYGFCPDDWKQATIVPLLKTGKNNQDPASYRPISLTSVLGKCFERIVKNRLNWHLEQFNLIPQNQAGFRRGCSTHDHIWNLENTIKTGFNNNMDTHCVFLDIAKAYDSVWIPGLLLKLSKCKVSGPILQWLKNFLTDRIVKVRLEDTTSEAKIVSTGVPQGSVLSPALFNVMTRD